MILQNQNGPCPLMSIANVLLLRGKIDLAEGIERIDAEGLLNAVGRKIPSHFSEIPLRKILFIVAVVVVVLVLILSNSSPPQLTPSSMQLPTIFPRSTRRTLPGIK